MTSMEGASCTRESLNKESSLYLKNYKTERHATLAKKLMQRSGSHGFNNLGVKICKDFNARLIQSAMSTS